MLKQIIGFEDYFVDELGNVYSNKKGNMKLMKLEQHVSGYLYVNLFNEHGRSHKRVHRLVAEAFVINEDPENKTIVMHLNDNKTDNRACNLKWGDISENTQSAVDHGLMVNDRGYDDSQSIPVIAINLKTGEEMKFGSIRECARSLNVYMPTIARQVRGETKTKPRCGYLFKRDDSVF